MLLLSLPLKNMENRHPGLTPNIASYYYEAARICLDRYHAPPKEFTLLCNEKELITNVEWEPSNEREKAAWANEDDTTRDGAYACALAATEIGNGFVAVRRAETKTGSDYYVAPTGKTYDDLEDCYRLEISGTNLDIPEVRRRLKIKIEQTKKGRSNLPALAAVVGFKVRLILIQTAEIEK
jgi:hypothetical protein